ncbi:DUF1302 family protein [Verrucomicrobiota bacterium]
MLDGFDDGTELVSANRAKTFGSSIGELDGSVGLSAAYNYAQDRPDEGEPDYRGLSRLRGQLELGLDVSLPLDWKGRISGHAYYDAVYSLRGRDEYTDELLDSSEAEVEFDELYLRGSLTDNLDAKLGRQSVVWGKSDNIRVTDILNPLDKREPGMVDIEFLRLPVTMTRLDYYLGKWDLAALLIHEVRFSKRPAFGSDFCSSTSTQPPEREPATTWENTQYAAALSGIVGKWDIAFYLADVFDDRGYVEEDPVSAEKERHHARALMAGTAASVVAGDWLFKMEMACFDGLRYSADADDTKTRYDVLAGVEYRGMSDTVISLEVANRHIVGFEESMSDAPDYAQEDEFQSALRITRDCWRETLRLCYLLRLSGTDGGDGAFQRFWAEYAITDAIRLTVGIVDYVSGDVPPYDTIGDSDRAFADVRYSF